MWVHRDFYSLQSDLLLTSLSPPVFRIIGCRPILKYYFKHFVLYCEIMQDFGKDYLNYWKGTIEKSIDGTIIAGAGVLDFYLQQSEIKKSNRILDLGCSFGRMHDTLANYSDHVFGIDVSLDVINEAKKKDYSSLVVGKAESTPFPSSYFDGIVAWGVFDVVNQSMALLEASRILRPNGFLLFTAKNSNYLPNDTLAFTAERNAKLKGFPNHFTNLELLLNNLSSFGFSKKKIYLFEKRGDIGLNKPCEKPECLERYLSYEYLLVLEKIGDSTGTHPDTVSSEYSIPAHQFASTADFGGDVMSFFRYHFDSDRNSK